MSSLSDRLFAAEDVAARDSGLEVCRLPGGGRSYRDPRFDHRRSLDSHDPDETSDPSDLRAVW